jgi:hypothetical protein
MPVTATDIVRNADMFRRAGPRWPDAEGKPIMTTTLPTTRNISAALRKAGFGRGAVLSRATMHHRYATGFYVRSSGANVYVSWRPETPLVTPSAAWTERNRATALEMVAKYAAALKDVGWPAEVIHLNGPLVRVFPRES